MLGAEGGQCSSKLDGVVPQLCSELFRTFSSQTKKGELEYQIHASYVEIYAHRVYDLLAPDPPGKAGARPGPSGHGLPECALKETWDGEWQVEGATCERVCSSAGLTALIERATLRRTTSSNSVHEHSSRSHAFLTLMIEHRSNDGGTEARQVTRFHLVDLAGSETFDSVTGDVGINAGLLALGKVLMALSAKEALVEQGKPPCHVPYRDSTLSKMLKKVLGGNCLNMMLACLNPERDYAGETQNTLRYAQQASRVVNQTRRQTFESMLASDVMRNDEFDTDEVSPSPSPNPNPSPNPSPQPQP